MFGSIPKTLMWKYYLLVALSGLDAELTSYVLSHDGVEMNPVLHPHPIQIIIDVKIFTLLFMFVTILMTYKKRFCFINSALIGCLISQGIAVVWSLYLIGRGG